MPSVAIPHETVGSEEVLRQMQCVTSIYPTYDDVGAGWH
jgi:hypothetical protein